MHRLSLAAILATALGICVLGCTPNNSNGNPDAGPDGGPSGGTRRCDNGRDECLAGEACNTTTGECFEVPSCARGDLSCTSAVPSCDPNAPTACEACTADSQCSGAFSKCSAQSPDECVQCLTHADCPSSTPLCEQGRCGTCTAGSCAAGSTCVGGACRQPCGSCSSPTPYCDTASFDADFCVECLEASHCGGAQACVRGRCVTPVPGDSCKNPELITLKGGTTIVEGRVPHLAGADLAPGSLDMFYAFDVAQSGTLNVTLQPLGSVPADVDHASELLSGDACARKVIATEGFTDSPMDQVFLTPGRYTHRVFFSGGAYPYRITYSFTPGTGVTGNSCMLPLIAPIGAPGGSTATVTVNRDGLQPIDGDPCDGTVDGPDAVVQFTLQETSGVTATLTPKSATAAAWAGFASACNEEGGLCGQRVTGTQTVALQRLEAGTHQLLLRNLTDSYDVKLTAVRWWTNDTCTDAIPVTFENGVARVVGDTRYTFGGVSGCGRELTKGLYYSFSTVGLGARSLKIVKKAGAATTQVALNTSCPGASAAAEYCWNATGSYPEFNSLPEGEYTLDVTAADAFDLELTLGPPLTVPGNDTCLDSQPLALSSNAFTVTGDTRGANDDFTPACATDTTFRGRDVVYSVFLPRGTLDVTVNPEDGLFSPVVSVGLFECTTSASSCGAAGGLGQNASASFRSAGQGVTIIVDGQDGTSGPFTLDGVLTPPAADDVCSGSSAISPGDTLTRSLSNYYPDGDPVCGLAAAGPDVFFSFTPVVTKSYTVTVTPIGFDAMVSVNDLGADFPTCGQGLCLATKNAAGVGGAETATFTAAKLNQYVIIVRSASGTTSGSFTVTLQ